MEKHMTSYARFDPSVRVQYSDTHSQSNHADTWVVVGGFSFYSGERKKEYWVHIPSNYRTTGAVVPTKVKSLLKPNCNGGQAAVIHDYLVRDGRVRIAGSKKVVSLSEANSIFLEAMRVANVPKMKRWFIYACAIFCTCFGNHRSS